MLTLDVGLLAALAGLLGTLGGALALALRLFKRFARMEEAALENQRDIRVIYRALFACLDGMKQLGCNGEVSRALERMKQQLIDE